MIRTSLPMLTVLLSLTLPAMAVAPCANEAEREAMAMRVLQSEFMMAGVACNQAQAYNTFITRYQPIISAEGLKLKAYFTRTGGGEKQLNDFITDLANAWSQVHMKDMKGFCTSTWERMWVANSKTIDRTNLMVEARDRAALPIINANVCAGTAVPLAQAVASVPAKSATATPDPKQK